MENYNIHRDNHIKNNPVPIILKIKLNHLQDEKNIYSPQIYKESLQISEYPGDEIIYLN
jgi:hypothetical protein